MTTQPIDVPDNTSLMAMACNTNNFHGLTDFTKPCLPTLVGRVGMHSRVRVHVERVGNVFAPDLDVRMQNGTFIETLVSGPLHPYALIDISLQHVANMHIGSLELRNASLVNSVLSDSRSCINHGKVSVKLHDVATVITERSILLRSLSTLLSDLFVMSCAYHSNFSLQQNNVANVRRAGNVSVHGRSSLTGDAMTVLNQMQSSNVSIRMSDVANVHSNSLLIANSSNVRGRSTFQIGELTSVDLKANIRNVANLWSGYVSVQNSSLVSIALVGARNLVGKLSRVRVRCENIANVYSLSSITISRFSGVGSCSLFFRALNGSASVQIASINVSNLHSKRLTMSSFVEIGASSLLIFKPGSKQNLGAQITMDNVANVNISGPIRLINFSRFIRSLFAIFTTVNNGENFVIKAINLANIRHTPGGVAFIDNSSMLVEQIVRKNETMDVDARSLIIELQNVGNVAVPLTGEGSLLNVDDIFQGNDTSSAAILRTSQVGQVLKL